MSAEPNRRATLVEEICERTGITEAMIAALVDTFYGRVREDSLLAPVFARVENWDEHLAKLRAFWSSVVLMSDVITASPCRPTCRFPSSRNTSTAGWHCSNKRPPTSARRPQRHCSWGGTPDRRQLRNGHGHPAWPDRRTPAFSTDLTRLCVASQRFSFWTARPH